MENFTQYLDRLNDHLAPYPWAWTALAGFGLLLAAWLANFITKKIALRALQKGINASPLGAEMDMDGDGQVKLNVIPRLANAVPALVVYAGVGALPDLPESFITVTRALCQAFIVVTVALAISRLLNFINTLYERRPNSRNKPIKGYIQIIKIIMFVLVGLSVIATLIGAKFLHLITGLGAMTAVLMLIFQDTILSLVASVQISNDGRVRIGDWIEMPSQNADGDVIDIALHTVTVQNWDMTVTTIPTKKLISDSFKNWRNMSERGGRRIKRSLLLDQASVRFLSSEEIDKLERFALLREYLDGKEAELEEWNAQLVAAGKDPVNARRVTNLGTFRVYVEHYLRAHPQVHQEMTLLVRQLQPTETGIPLEIYCFSNDTRWAYYEKLQADIFDHLLAILPEFGLQVFQTPSGSDVRRALGQAQQESV